MTKEALKLALEALEQYAEYEGETRAANEAITAIKEALAQPEQEPVAFVKGCNRGQWEIFPAKAYQIFEKEQPLYTAPPQRKPLTDEEIAETLTGYRLSDAIDITRAIEAVHEIKG